MQKQVFLTLAVTKNVLREVQAGRQHQRQIAIRGGSPALLAVLDEASDRKRIAVALNGVFQLLIGDTRAIWEAQQSEALQAEDFKNLYELLARRPEQPVTFSWEEAKQPD